MEGHGGGPGARSRRPGADAPGRGGGAGRGRGGGGDGAVRGGDRGSATVWTAFAACALCVVFGAVLALGQAVTARHRAGGAADLAALAAADRALWGEGDACAAAVRVAEAQGATVVGCRVREDIADVTARATSGPWSTEAASRAGPAGLPGLPGLPGLSGLPGLPGLSGQPGLPGLGGLQGLRGLQGPQGLSAGPAQRADLPGPSARAGIADLPGPSAPSRVTGKGRSPPGAVPGTRGGVR
ncbi:Rv3654c family TadE-like protein [Streptomyces sp. NPDC048659]|uniref:Rv3654c family TadE-like protein n=1 Tax=Streptomyces sp. NPDC048659 TaxID=3155489 RepID=UPI00342CA451